MGSPVSIDGSTTLADEDAGPSQLEFVACTDVGIKRTHNEDAVAACMSPFGETGCLLLVADGMGGHANGQLASSETARQIVAVYQKGELANPKSFRTAFDDVDAFLHAHVEGGGTTLVVAVVAGSALTVANIGDSRAYLLRADLLRQLTRDDSWVQSQVDSGHITPEQARTHPRRNVILKALGPGRKEGAEVLSMRFLPGDVVMLCSDGLHGVVDDEQIARVLSSGNSMETVCNDLVRLALDAGAPDNISIALCQSRNSNQE